MNDATKAKQFKDNMQAIAWMSETDDGGDGGDGGDDDGELVVGGVKALLSALV
ncbi:hypothetical protein TWF730_005816 [Orbilia blumenaviensis]|uniref:Uncharacterized protein n=1 Tax=Orbilia blumenaviensis TaxID=1796055 RepID=A0AAV9VJQ5_9PEZI